MTILFLSRLFCPHIGGVERHVLEISKILIKKGYKIIVVTEELEEGILKQVQDDKVEIIDGIGVIRMPYFEDDFWKKFRIWLWMLKNINLIKSANIIHCHDVFYWYLPFRFLFLFKPVFTTFHGYESFPVRKGAILVRKISEKLSWGNICIGDFIAKWYGAKASFISYGGVRPAPSVKSLASSLREESGVFFGRLDDQTGILTYLKTFEILKKIFPNFKLTVIGSGKHIDRVIDKDIKVLPFQKDVQKYLQTNRFIFVSSYLSILEAMVAKKLIFAVFENTLKEDYLKMSPFAKYIIIENDPEKLAQKVKYYLNHKDEEKRIVQKAYIFAKTQTWEKVVEIYLRLWEI